MTERRASKTKAKARRRSTAPEREGSSRAGGGSSRGRPAPARTKPVAVVPPKPVPSEPGTAAVAAGLPLFPDFVPDYEWVLGVVPNPAPQPGRAAVVPWVALLLEAGSGLVIHVDLLASVTAKAVGATLRRAVERGEALGLRRPTRIRVGVPEHASLFGEAVAAGMAVVVGPVPEVEEVLRTPGAMKAAALPTTDDVDVWRGSAAIADARLAAFFEAAEELRRGRFWRVVEDDRSLRLTCAALGLPPWGVRVEADSPRGGLRVRVHEGSLSVRFDRAGELSAARRRELAGFRFAPRRGPYPVLSPVGEDGRLRRAEGDDYDLATAALLATCRFGSEYGELLRRTSLRALVARYSIRLGRAHVVEVEIGRPEPALAGR